MTTTLRRNLGTAACAALFGLFGATGCLAAADESDVVDASDASDDAIRATQVVYVNFDGVTVGDCGGCSDARSNQSFAIGGHYGVGQKIFAPWSGDRAGVIARLQAMYAPYNVQFTTSRPGGGDYTMVVISSSDGPNHGVAPQDCGNGNPNDIAFVHKVAGKGADLVARYAAHELGHSFGLAHVTSSADVMHWASKGSAFTNAAYDTSPNNYVGQCAGGSHQDEPRMLADALGTSSGGNPGGGGARASLVGLKMTSTGSNQLEVHALSAESGYTAFSTHAATPLEQSSPDVFTYLTADWNRDGAADVIAVKMNHTGTGSTEVHVVDGASGFARFGLNTGTPLGETTRAQWQFAAGDFNADGAPDLYAFSLSANGSGTTEVHILDGATNFQSWLLHTATPLETRSADNTALRVGDFNRDGREDVLFVGMNATGTGSTEVHVLDAATSFQTWLLNTGTPLHETSAGAWAFGAGDVDGDGVVDLTAISQHNGAATTEAHVLSGASGFSQWLLHVATPLEATTPTGWQFAM